MAHKGLIRFHLLYSFNLSHRQKLRSLISGLMEKEKKFYTSIDYIFCSDEYLLEINTKHLQHTDLTDIITFDLSDTAERIIGEIYISIDRVKENALLYSNSFSSELHRVMIHGALHLCGYKDKTSLQKKEMRKKEDLYLDSI